jgi:hypothetical protein
MLKLPFALFAFPLVKLFGFRRARKNMVPRYIACWTEDDGIYFCGHQHETIADALKCLVPDGRSFIRAFQDGESRSLNESEYQQFLDAVKSMSWSQR